MSDARNTSTKIWLFSFTIWGTRFLYSDMPTAGTPEKEEYISVAAKRWYNQARGKIFRFQSCVGTLVQLTRYSLHRFKRNKSTCLAVTAPAVTGTSLSEDEEEEEDGMVFNDEDDNMIDEEVTDTSASVSAPHGGRFLMSSTYAPPPVAIRNGNSLVQMRTATMAQSP